MFSRHFVHLLAGAVAAGGFSMAYGADQPRGVQSAGSAGAHTPALEAKSTSPVPIAKAGTPAAPISAADQALIDRVVTALNGDNTLKGAEITVLAAKGKVTLSGDVKNQPQADKAMAIAKRAAGGANVTHSMTSLAG